MKVKKLNGFLFGNVVFRTFNEDTEKFDDVRQFSSYNSEEKSKELLEMKVVAIHLADVGEYCGEKCDSDKGVLVVEVE